MASPATWHATALTPALEWDVELALPVVDTAASGVDSEEAVLPLATSAVDRTTLHATARLRL